jgi:hypothetical protein
MSEEAMPFTKEWADYAGRRETVPGQGDIITDLDGNKWKVGYFDVPTQTYWCTRVEKNFVLLHGGRDDG